MKGSDITSEQVLVLAKGVGAPNVQSVIITSLVKKKISKNKKNKRGQRGNQKKHKQMPKHLQTRAAELWFNPSTQKMPGLWKEVYRVLQGQPLQGGLQRWEE